MKKTILSVGCLLVSFLSFAQTPTLVKDINTKYLSSNASDFYVHGNYMYFVAENNPFTGKELWRTDGTDTGTHFIKDVWSGARTSSIKNYQSVGKTLFFTANDGINGVELWKTDGTDTGTVLVKDINSGTSSSNPGLLTEFNGKLLFKAWDGVNGEELWISDGTDTGTKLVKDIYSGSNHAGINQIVVNGDTAYFRGSDGINGIEIWMSDGTEAGTKMIKDINSGSGSSAPSYLVAFNNKVYFSANDNVSGYELWETDGTSAGTKIAVDYWKGSKSCLPQHMTVVGNYIYFSGVDSAKGRELMRTDGTVNGTIVVKDLDRFGSSSPYNLLKVGRRLFFIANVDNGRELYVSDGTSSGTKLTRDLYPIQTDGAIAWMTAVDSTLYFRAHQSPNYQDYELYSVKPGSTYPSRVKNIGPSDTSGNPQYLTSFKGKLFFSANDYKHGIEIWVSDKTKTELFLDVYSGTQNSGIVSMAPVKGGVIFNANDGDGDVLWKSDGSEAGTFDVNMKSRHSVSERPRKFYNGGGKYTYFTGYRNSQEYLYRTENGALLDIASIYRPGNSVTVKEMLQIGNTLYFTRRSSSFTELLYKSVDGKGAGLVKELNRSRLGDRVKNLGELKGLVYYSAYDEANYGQELFKSTGTSSGTELVKNINSGKNASNPANLTTLDTVLLFSATEGSKGYELWRTEGTSATTEIVKDINPSGSSGISNMVAMGGNAYFQANDGTNGPELWMSDGTESGTKMLKEIISGSDGGQPKQLVVMDTTLFFVAFDSTNGWELWTSNGTEAGTKLLKDINPGIANADIGEMLVVRDILYFTANDGTHGAELWKTDGTSAGTKMIDEVNKGVLGSNPALLTVSSDTLYYVADHIEYGRELFYIYTQCMVVGFEAESSCVGVPINFKNKSNDLGTTISSYAWDFGNGKSSTDENPKNSYDTAGIYNVKLVIENTDGCRLETEKTINIDPLPEASFTLNRDSQCLSGNNYVFTNTSTPATGVSYLWDYHNGKTSTGKNGSQVYTIASQYEVKLYVTLSAACKDTAKKLITVLPKPGDLNIIGPLTSKQKTETYKVNATAGSTYDWSITFGKQISGGNTNEITVEWKDGGKQDFVKVVETNSAGCKGSQKSITVSIDIVGIEEIGMEGNYNLYPNPSNGTINVSFDNMVSSKSSIQIFNTVGAVVYKEEWNQKGKDLNRELDLKHLPAGIYKMTLINGDGMISSSIHISN